MSTNLSPKIASIVIIFTLVFAFLGYFFSDFLREMQMQILTLLLVTIGLPHGATDYLLFKRGNKDKMTRKQIIRFFISYVGTVIGFLLFWFIFPICSFVVFITISAYHFGQSNWESTLSVKAYSVIVNILWGAFAIGGFILWSWPESKIIIEQVIGSPVEISDETSANAQLIVIAVNCAVILLLKLYKAINKRQMWAELGKIFILSVLFYSTPMLVGFSIYFGLWHSLSSLNSQLNYYKRLWPSFNLKHYYLQAAPYTLLALAGLCLMILAHPVLLPDVSIISTFVIFIACVTLPHIFLVEESYQHLYQ